MPLLSSFHGIAIKMYYLDHAPPHFHAIDAEHEALIRIDGGEALRGSLPRRASRLVEEWRRIHVAALGATWERAHAGEPIETIAPLE